MKHKIYYTAAENYQIDQMNNHAKTTAAKLNAHHFRTLAGFYGSDGGRFFLARANGEKLEVSADFGASWQPAPLFFRDHNGRSINLED